MTDESRAPPRSVLLKVCLSLKVAQMQASHYRAARLRVCLVLKVARQGRCRLA
jgi:hypothetical protein